MVNQAGSTLTVTPFGGSTAHRSDGLLTEPAHVPPVAILIFPGSVLGREHKKLRKLPVERTSPGSKARIGSTRPAPKPNGAAGYKV